MLGVSRIVLDVLQLMLSPPDVTSVSMGSCWIGGVVLIVSLGVRILFVPHRGTTITNYLTPVSVAVGAHLGLVVSTSKP